MPERMNKMDLLPEEGSKYDVIVGGGGPAGLGAALAAARSGAKTLLLEARSFFGGVASLGLWMPVNRLKLDGGSRGGIHDLFVSRIRSYGPSVYMNMTEDFINGDGLNIQPEYLSLAAFELLEESGCHYQLYSPVTGVIKEGDRVKGVVITTKEGPKRFDAEVVVDATGDGDIAWLAGAPMVKGREEDGLFMGITLSFALANVNVDKIMDYSENHRDEFKALIDSAKEQGYLTTSGYWFYRTPIPGVVSVNNYGTGPGSLDGTKSSDLTEAERFGNKLATDFIKIAREKRIPGLEDCYLMRTGSAVGVRETRRIVGEYVMTLEDALSGPEFDDVVARKYGAVDAVYYQGAMKSGHAYPYRSMLPKDVDGLLAAGRCGSATHLGHAAGKSMGNMMALGQAAGVAAAVCSKTGVLPRNLDVKRVQAILREMGVKL